MSNDSLLYIAKPFVFSPQNCDTSSCLNFSCDIRSLPVGDVQILVDSNIDERFFAASVSFSVCGRFFTGVTVAFQTLLYSLINFT